MASEEAQRKLVMSLAGTGLIEDASDPPPAEPGFPVKFPRRTLGQGYVPNLSDQLAAGLAAKKREIGEGWYGKLLLDGDWQYLKHVLEAIELVPDEQATKLVSTVTAQDTMKNTLDPTIKYRLSYVEVVLLPDYYRLSTQHWVREGGSSSQPIVTRWKWPPVQV